jgi:hypothetical protein
MAGLKTRPPACTPGRAGARHWSQSRTGAPGKQDPLASERRRSRVLSPGSSIRPRAQGARHGSRAAGGWGAPARRHPLTARHPDKWTAFRPRPAKPAHQERVGIPQTRSWQAVVKVCTACQENETTERADPWNDSPREFRTFRFWIRCFVPAGSPCATSITGCQRSVASNRPARRRFTPLRREPCWLAPRHAGRRHLPGSTGPTTTWPRRGPRQIPGRSRDTCVNRHASDPGRCLARRRLRPPSMSGRCSRSPR